MLEEKTIKLIKRAGSYMTPIAWREDLERCLEDHAFWVEQYYANNDEDIGTATIREMREQNGDQ